jgi:hypothetical protein
VYVDDVDVDVAMLLRGKAIEDGTEGSTAGAAFGVDDVNDGGRQKPMVRNDDDDDTMQTKHTRVV